MACHQPATWTAYTHVFGYHGYQRGREPETRLPPSSATAISIRGNSYRLKDKLKAGLVRPAEASE